MLRIPRACFRMTDENSLCRVQKNCLGSGENEQLLMYVGSVQSSQGNSMRCLGQWKEAVSCSPCHHWYNLQASSAGLRSQRPWALAQAQKWMVHWSQRCPCSLLWCPGAHCIDVYSIVSASRALVLARFVVPIAVYLSIHLVIYSPLDGHLDCYQFFFFLAITNYTAMNTNEKALCGYILLFVLC